MKKLTIFLSVMAAPFLLVWAGFILTGFSFNPHNVFHAGAFWGLSCMYWFLAICLAPMIIDDIDNQKIKKHGTETV